MATPAWTFDPSAQLRYGNQVMAATVALNNGDTSANLELGGYADVSLQFESLVGSPTLVVQASNDGSNVAAEASVGARVRALCARFPIYRRA